MTTPKTTRLPVLFGGEDITLRKLDGTEIKARVAIVPMRHLGTFIEIYDNAAALLEFVTHVGKLPVEEGFADALEDGSVYAVRELAHRLNFARASEFIDKQVTAGKEVAKQFLERVAPELEKITREQAEKLFPRKADA